jgi:hypothetical protein
MRREAGDLRGFAGAFGALEGDEFAGGFCFRGMGKRCGTSAPVGEEGFEVGRATGSRRANIVSAGADAEREAGLGVEAEQLARENRR